MPLTLLGGCALQPAYKPPSLKIPEAWNTASTGPMAFALPADHPMWWTLLEDPAVDQLVAAGLADNPTLAEASARTDQARALLGLRGAGKLPTVGMEGGATRSADRADPASGSTSQTSATLSARLSWELDLWGRVRESTNAAHHRLSARTADAQAARLSVIGDITDTTIALRACGLTLNIRHRDITSRQAELTISDLRFSLGNIAAVDVAAARSNLAAVQTDRIAQAENCQRLTNALVALSGLDVAAVGALISASPSANPTNLPVPPPYTPALPATVLLNNPGIIAAEREVAARWSEIAFARAEKMPRIDLAAILTGQWISALGSDNSYSSGSVGATLAAPLFDGGAGSARVGAAQAAYREAVAQLNLAIRTTVREIEDALAAQQSALQRVETSREALEAARFALQTNEARWRAGAIALFELEDARRQFNRAQESAISADADRARAWVALMRRTGRATHEMAPTQADQTQP